jgi:hypothetical protein
MLQDTQEIIWGHFLSINNRGEGNQTEHVLQQYNTTDINNWTIYVLWPFQSRSF